MQMRVLSNFSIIFHRCSCLIKVEDACQSYIYIYTAFFFVRTQVKLFSFNLFGVKASSQIVYSNFYKLFQRQSTKVMLEKISNIYIYIWF
jgi:hypothetical protein